MGLVLYKNGEMIMKAKAKHWWLAIFKLGLFSKPKELWADPNGITCLEIEKGNITLVKWEYKVSKDNLISVKRIVLEGKEPILNFFK